MSKLLLIILSVFLGHFAYSQEYDILLKGGRIIDPKNNIDKIADLAIKDGKIAAIEKSINSSKAKKIIRADGLIISPGFIDIHAHTFHGTNVETEYSDGYNALKPDAFTFKNGITTIVEAGGAGWRNFAQFKTQVIDQSKTRVLAFVNIVGNGMKGSPYEQDLNDMDPKLTAIAARKYTEVVGIKIAHYNGHDWTAVERAVEAGNLANIPVMVDFGSAKPRLPLETLFMEKLRPGDIYTHAFGGGNSVREAIVDDNLELRPFVKDAQERGIILDVGHGGASFFYEIAVPAYKAGVKPNTISTDAHWRSSMSGMKDMNNVMSKFLNLGMTLPEVIEASTWKPAQVIHREELGHLSIDAIADITIFSVRKGEFGFMDRTGGEKMMGDKKIETEMTIKGGKIIWDLNGLAVKNYGGN